MNKYLILFICFIGSLLLVTYEDNGQVRNSLNYQESIYVFNEFGAQSNVVGNPDTSDLNVLFLFVICVYSFIFLFLLVIDLKNLKKYCDVIIN